MENLSRLDELQIKYDDPVSHFKKIAEERTFEKKAAQKISVPIDILNTACESVSGAE